MKPPAVSQSGALSMQVSFLSGKKMSIAKIAAKIAGCRA
jgi:hypothetical protein